LRSVSDLDHFRKRTKYGSAKATTSKEGSRHRISDSLCLREQINTRRRKSEEHRIKRGVEAPDQRLAVREHINIRGGVRGVEDPDTRLADSHRYEGQ
jgi:hypothetical protein